jgi:hypothetical protein
MSPAATAGCCDLSTAKIKIAGTTINGQPSEPWSQAPRSDGERF